MRSEWLVGILLLDLLFITTLSKLVDTVVIDLVLPSLKQVNEEDDVVTESSQTVQSRHLDSESEEVVDEGVEELVRHGAAGHVRDGFEAVVDVQAGDLGELLVGILGIGRLGFGV